MTILFVDDEDGVRSSYEMLLDMWAKKAYSAKDGKEGLAVFEQYRPDIVVTDIKMPVMNGLEMSRRIKEIDPETPIIITTAHQEPELLLDAVELHVDGYIVKPIAKKELKKRLETVAKAILFDRERDKQYDILRNVIDASLEAILVYRGNVCINVNSAALEMFGFSDKDEMIGKESLEQIGKALKCVENPEMECDRKVPYETLLFNKEGNGISALVRCRNIAVGKEELKIIAAIDLTHIKELEAEADQQEEIMIAQSRHAVMGEMISMIAHQWRQPITVISMGANNMLADIELKMVSEEALQEQAQSILRQTRYLSKTIDDFRNFFRPEKTIEEVTVEEVMAEAEKIIGKSLENNLIAFSVKHRNGYKVKTYSRELLQVCINLLKNAKEALMEHRAEDRKIDVVIGDNAENVIMTICDNGGGIDNAIIAKIFDPYFTTKDEKNGTGLGLYMSKTIVEKHLHGTISVENSSEGACFEIAIPLVWKGGPDDI